jgi:hypothetical protein
MGTCARAAGGDGTTLRWDDCPEGSEGADYYASRHDSGRQREYVAPEIFTKNTKFTLDYQDAQQHTHAFDLYGATFYRRKILKRHKYGIDAIYSIWITDDTRVVAHTPGEELLVMSIMINFVPIRSRLRDYKPAWQTGPFFQHGSLFAGHIH